jgi:hypothetical protein
MRRILCDRPPGLVGQPILAAAAFQAAFSRLRASLAKGPAAAVFRPCRRPFRPGLSACCVATPKLVAATHRHGHGLAAALKTREL